MKTDMQYEKYHNRNQTGYSKWNKQGNLRNKQAN